MALLERDFQATIIRELQSRLVYVFRKYGHSIYHGSNRIARVEVDELLPISQAKPGIPHRR